MKHMPGFTDFFMSPVTGRIILNALPDITEDYVWIGDYNDRPYASPILLDLELEIIELRNRLAKTHFIIQHPSDNFLNSQVLDELVPGILQHNDGVISIATILPVDILPDLPYHEIWIGDETNRPVAQGRIWDDGVGHGNLPAYTPTEANKIWRMNEDGIPILTDALTSAEISIGDIISDISSIISDIAGIVGDISSIFESIATITDNISSIFDSIATITGNISSIFDSIATITDNIAAIFDSIASILTTITGINDAIAIFNADIIAINDAIAVINAQIIAINDAIAVINAQIVSINDAIGVINVTLGDLQTQIDTNISSGLDHLADLQAQIDAGISSGMDHLATINSEISSINDQITTINTDISDITTTLGDGSITLTGNVTGSGFTGTPFATTLTLTLDEIPLAAADVNINTHKLTNVVDPTAPQDAATKNYVDGLVGDGDITLSGAVTGTGAVGTTIVTTLASTVNMASGGETFSFPSSASSSAFTLLTNFTPTTLTPSNIELTLKNAIGSGFELLLTSSASGGTFPDGVFEFYAFTSSTSTQIYQCTSDLFTFQIPVTMTTDMSMSANKITNVLDPTAAQDAATKNYVDTRTVTLIGEVTGSGDLGTNINTTVVGPVALPFEFYTPNPTSDFTLINEFVPVMGTDSQVELRMWNNSFYGMVFQLNTTDAGGVYPEGVFQAFYKSSTTTLKAYEIFPTYVQFVMPVTMLSALDMSTNLIHNVVDPVSAQDAATKNYVDNSTVTLTGDVTGSGSVNSSFATTLTLHLNQIPLASGNVNLNSHQINNLAMAGSPAGTDAVNVSYLNSQIGSGTVILTGAVTGSGHVNDGGFATTLSSTVNMASGGETFSFGSTVSSAAFTLLANYVPTSLTPGNIELNLQNQRGSGFQLLLDSSSSGGTYPDGRFEFYAFTSSTSTQIYKCDSTLFTFNIPVTINNTLSMASNNITNVLDPVSAQDAATKHYVDTKTLDTFAAPAANLSLNSKKITSLATPTASTDAATKGYCDALASVSGAFSIGGALNMNSHLINNVTDPTSAQDAATKNYVDSRKACGTLISNPGTTTSMSAGLNTVLNGMTVAGNCSNFTAASGKLTYTGTPTVNVLVVVDLSYAFSVNSSVSIELYKNTSFLGFGGGTFVASGNSVSSSMSYVLSMSTNDYITLEMYSTQTGTLTLNQSYLSAIAC